MVNKNLPLVSLGTSANEKAPRPIKCYWKPECGGLTPLGGGSDSEPRDTKSVPASTALKPLPLRGCVGEQRLEVLLELGAAGDPISSRSESRPSSRRCVK